jgi:hypothetical protein
MRLDFGSRSKQSRRNRHALVVIGGPGKHDMKFSIAMAIVLTTAMLSAQASTQALAGSDQGRPCTARVLSSEELPFAPINTWLIKVTLEVTPPNGGAFVTSMQNTIPWQVRPPRQGQTFRVRCDPANPGALHLMPQAAAPTAF